MLGLPRADLCPLAHSLGWLQRPAAEPGRMTSPEQESTSPGRPSVNGQWAVTQVCVPGKSVNSLGTPCPGHRPQGALGHTPWLWVHTGAIIIIAPMGASPLVMKLPSQGALYSPSSPQTLLAAGPDPTSSLPSSAFKEVSLPETLPLKKGHYC